MASLLKGTGARFVVALTVGSSPDWLAISQLLQPCQEEWARVECRQNRLRNRYRAVATMWDGVGYLVVDFAPARETASRSRLRKCVERLPYDSNWSDQSACWSSRLASTS